MAAVIVLLFSVFFQFLTAVFSLSNIKLTERKISWLLIAAATILMGVRRIIPLYHFYTEDGYSLDLPNEIIGMIISLILLIGIAGIKYIFLEWNKNKKEIEILSKEKDILLKEVHHRIKNNMSVIKNLLIHQSSAIDIPEATAAFQDGIARIESMGILYEKLYQSEEYHEVSSREYLSQLTDEIFEIFPSVENIKIEKRISEFKINTDQIVPLGLILNELLTNTIKYAFKGRSSGKIIIEAFAEEARVVLNYEDNGVGLPEQADKKEPKGFGLKLIDMLVKQLYGTYEIRVDQGTGFFLRFPRKPEPVNSLNKRD